MMLGKRPSNSLGVIGHTAEKFPQNYRPVITAFEVALAEAKINNYRTVYFGPAGGSGHLAGMTAITQHLNATLIQPWADFGPDLLDWQKPTYSFVKSRVESIINLADGRPAEESARARLLLDWNREFLNRVAASSQPFLIAIWDGTENNLTGLMVKESIKQGVTTLHINIENGENFWL